jgi:hypothetical protein
MFEVLSLVLPGREAADMDMVGILGVIIAVSGELNLEFKLVTLHRHTTNRAVSPDAWSSPATLRGAVRQLPGLDHFAGFLA